MRLTHPHSKLKLEIGAPFSDFNWTCFRSSKQMSGKSRLPPAAVTNHELGGEGVGGKLTIGGEGKKFGGEIFPGGGGGGGRTHHDHNFTLYIYFVHK